MKKGPLKLGRPMACCYLRALLSWQLRKTGQWRGDWPPSDPAGLLEWFRSKIDARLLKKRKTTLRATIVDTSSSARII